MKKLNDIPKKQVFETPEDYFDSLPSRVQARIAGNAGEVRRPWAAVAVRYALPVLLALVVFTVWRTGPDNTAAGYEEILASVDTDALVAYLEETDVSTDELLESLDLTQDDVMEIENDVYDLSLEGQDLDALLDEYSFELNN